MNVVICEAPCCSGLREVADNDVPHLGFYIACEALQHVRTVYTIQYNTIQYYFIRKLSGRSLNTVE